MVPSVASAFFATTMNGGILRRAKYIQAPIRVKEKLEGDFVPRLQESTGINRFTAAARVFLITIPNTPNLGRGVCPARVPSSRTPTPSGKRNSGSDFVVRSPHCHP